MENNWLWKGFTSKGISLVGTVYDVKGIPKSDFWDIENRLKNGLFVSFVWRYWTPDDRSLLIERGLCMYGNDVENLWKYCENMWTIVALLTKADILNKVVHMKTAEPYIKIPDFDIKKGNF